MKHRVAAGIMVGAALLAGCRTNQSPVFERSEVVSAASMAGTWRGADGRTFTITETPGGGVRIASEAGEHTGVLVNVGGRTIVEVPLSVAREMGEDAAPVYHYGRLRVSGETLEHQPLSAAWLSAQEQGSEGIASAPLASGMARVTVTDAGTMRRLLERAAGDERAWGEKEVLARIKP